MTATGEAAWLTEVPITHRGLHDSGRAIPENSLAAFKAAVEAGYGIELDVRRTADDIPIVLHDHVLDDLTDKAGAVVETLAAEVTAARLTGTRERIPTFAEALELVAGRVPLLVEIKNFRDVLGPLEGAVAGLLRGYDGPFAIQSFNPLVLEWFEQHLPDAPRGQVTTEYGHWCRTLTEEEQAALPRLVRAGVGAPAFFAHDVRFLPHSLAKLGRERNLPLVMWTVHDAEERYRAEIYGDNIIFEGFRP